MTIPEETIPLDFTHPGFNKTNTSHIIFRNSEYTIKYLPNFPVTLIYSTSEDSELPKLLSNFKVDPFIILEPYEHKTNEFFRFSIINQQYCLIISILSKESPFYIYNFIKSILSAVAIFRDQEKKSTFESYFRLYFIHYQYYNDSIITKNLIDHLSKTPKIGEFFKLIINYDPRIKYTLYEAISQVINSVFAYYVKRHDFYRYKIKMNNFINFSENYKVLNTIYTCNSYEIKVVFHSTSSMLFIYKFFIGANSLQNAYREKRYIENQTFESILQIVGLFQTNQDFVLVYEYSPFYKLNNSNLSSKTVDNCLLNLLKALDSIHSREYIIQTLNIDTILFRPDNSIFFCNYHEFSKVSSGFEKDLSNFGYLIKEVKCSNKYLKELEKCICPYGTQLEKIGYKPCFPVTQYFIFRTQKIDKNFDKFKFDDNRKDNQVLFDPKKQKYVGVIKTLIFCYANTHDIRPYLNNLPNAKDDPLTYIELGEEMLDFNEKKGILILNRVIESSTSTLMKDKAYYIIGKYYFFKKKFMLMQDYFTKISNDGKIFYIIGRIYQKNLFSNLTEKSMIYSSYYSKSLEFNYWRTFYRDGLEKMENKDFDSAKKSFLEAQNLAVSDIEEDKELFGLLGDDYEYLIGMISYNLAICYKKINDFVQMKEYFIDAVNKNCKLAFASLSYVLLIEEDYEKSFELLRKASDFLPLNFNLIIEINFRLICKMIDADRAENARKNLNLAIKLFANSQNCDENSKNYLIKGIQKYSVIVGNLFNSRDRITDAYPCYALAAAFGHFAGFIGLATILFSQKNYLSALICMKQFMNLFHVHDSGNEFIENINNLIDRYPIYMKRTAYFEIGSLLFYASRSPYIPFDFLIKASYLTLPDVAISDFKFINQLDNKSTVILNSILKHYQYLPQEKEEEQKEKEQKEKEQKEKNNNNND